MIAGHEFGTDKGAVFIITRALYGLKSAGAAWRTFFAQALTRLEFKPMQGDRDVYIKPQTKPNGDRYYEMLLVYVNDILIISHDTKPIIDDIASQFCLKEDSLCTPNKYLGTMIKIYTDNSGSECWAMSSDEYVKAVVTDVAEDLEKQGLKLKGKAYNYSPVVNDVTFRVVVARMIIENLKGKVVDIDNAFLNGDLEHEIYMKIPEGYDEVINPRVDKEDCLIL